MLIYGKSLQTLLIIKVDAIGDYILFRNFLREIRNDEKFKHHRITLLGNVAWKGLFESFDQSYVDDVIWVERKKLMNSPWYLFQLLRQIRKGGFETVFNPTYWRDYYVDSLVRVSGATRKLGGQAFGPYYSNHQIAKSSNVYNEPIDFSAKLFEFYKFRSAVEQLLGRNLSHVNTYFPEFGKLPDVKIPYFVIAPGANAEFRRWKPSHYAEVANYIFRNTDWKCWLVGSPDELNLAESLISFVDPIFVSRVKNEVGQKKLDELPQIFHQAKLALCNDSGTLHIAIASKCKVVCISNGNHYQRFVPYPNEMGIEGIFIFPDVFDNPDFKEEEKIAQTSFQSPYDIQLIPPSKVQKALQKSDWLKQ